MIHSLKVFLSSDMPAQDKFCYHEMWFHKAHILYTVHQWLFDVWIYRLLVRTFYHLYLQFRNQNNLHINLQPLIFTCFHICPAHMFSNLEILNIEDNLGTIPQDLTSVYYRM